MDGPSAGDRHANLFENVVGTLIVLSRYLLVVFYLGLVVALAIYALVFARFIWILGLNFAEASVLQALATMLQLIDAALVASLTIMVVFSNYENFVGRVIPSTAQKVSWLGRLDPSELKIKIATTVITISSIYMLKVLIEPDGYTFEQIIMRLMICAFFVFAGLALVAIDRLAVKPPAE